MRAVENLALRERGNLLGRGRVFEGGVFGEAERFRGVCDEDLFEVVEGFAGGYVDVVYYVVEEALRGTRTVSFDDAGVSLEDVRLGGSRSVRSGGSCLMGRRFPCWRLGFGFATGIGDVDEVRAGFGATGRGG